MSAPDLGRLADLLIGHVAGLDIMGAALYPLCAEDIAAPDLAAIEIPLRGHPADELRWYRPPAGCVALGLVAGGWVAPTASVRPSAHPDAQRIVQAVVLGRDGELAARCRYPDRRVVDLGPGGVGRVPDALRRAIRRAA